MGSSAGSDAFDAQLVSIDPQGRTAHHALVTYGYIFVEAEVILVCRAEGLDAGLYRAQGCEWTSALPPPCSRSATRMTEDRDSPLTLGPFDAPDATSATRFQGRMTRVDIDRRLHDPRSPSEGSGGRGPRHPG